MASYALIGKGKLLLPVEAKKNILLKKKININYFKCSALYYSNSDKTDKSNAVCDGERI